MRRILTLFLLLASFGALAADAPAEIRAAWVSAFANGAPATPAQLEQAMEGLKKAGANAVYIDAARDGQTLFPSRALKAAGGAERHAALAADKRDLFEEALIEAHRHGLYAYAWFDAGFVGASKGAANAVLQEAVRQYDVDGIALDAQAPGAAALAGALGQAYPGLGLAMLPAPAALDQGAPLPAAAAPTTFAARQDPIRLWRYPLRSTELQEAWKTSNLPRGRYSLVGRSRGGAWEVVREIEQDRMGVGIGEYYFFVNSFYSELELVPNRRELLRRKPRA